MSKIERQLPAITIIVFSALSLMAIETSRTLTVDGKPPSERLAFALSNLITPKNGATTLFSSSIAYSERSQSHW